MSDPAKRPKSVRADVQRMVFDVEPVNYNMSDPSVGGFGGGGGQESVRVVS